MKLIDKRIVSVILIGCIMGGLLAGCENRYEYRTDGLSACVSMEGSETLPGMAENLCVSNDTIIPAGDLEHIPYAAGLFNITDQEVLYAKNIHESLQPASITKLLTALVALKYGNLSDKVAVSENALITESGAKLCGFVPGCDLTLEQAMYGLLVYSGNDAGVVIAEHLAGSVEAFSDMMNEEARAIGATNTHFVNPHGLTAEGHHTTVYDLYLIFSELMKYPKFMEIIQTRSYTYTPGAGREPVTWENTNWFFTGEATAPTGITVIGGKTGNTAASGACLIILSTDTDGKQYISVVLKAADRSALYQEMSDLLKEIKN